MATEESKTEQLTAVIREIQGRVRARHPGGSLGIGDIAFPDLMPIVHARDAAEAKVAAIGRVNPRPPGLLHSIAQSVKKLISRALDWHVREQVEFNRAAVLCVQAILETFEDVNRVSSQLAGHLDTQISAVRTEMARMQGNFESELLAHGQKAEILLAESRELKDIRKHWSEWRAGFDEQRLKSEVYMLRTISELSNSYQHRLTNTEAEFRRELRQMHEDYERALLTAAKEVQEKMWQDMLRARGEIDAMIHGELRVLRQRIAATPQSTQAAPAPLASGGAQDPAPTIDWLRFADRFRGAEEDIRKGQQIYIERFRGAAEVLDLGCGRGEFLEAAQEAGLPARGIDLSAESIGVCHSKGLQAETADMFGYLRTLPDSSVAGVRCAQVIEHLPPALLPELINLIGAKAKPGSIAAFETPNPECLAIFGTHFYLDPTHTRPVPAPLLVFYLEEAGFGEIEVQPLSPAAESMPSLNAIPEPFREAFFGGLDYVVFAKKLNQATTPPAEPPASPSV